VKTLLVPTTGEEWMGQTQSRLAALERHRHPSNGSGESNVWFRAEAARVDTPITAADGAYSKVPLATATDPFGLLNETFGFVAPRDGAVQFSSSVSVNLNGPNSGNVFTILYDEDTGLTVLRGTQFASPTPVWPGGLDQVVVLSGIVNVVASHTYTLWAFVASGGNTKKFASYPENTFLTGAYIDGSTTPGAKGDTGPMGPTGATAGLDSGWHYLGTTGEPALAGGITVYSSEGTDWGPGRFRRDGAGCVHLDGLLLTASGAPPFLRVFTLPVGFRPATRQLFSILADSNAPPSQIEVLPNGEVNIVYASTAGGRFLFMSAITFMAEDAMTVAWIPLTLQNGWTDYDTFVGTPGKHGAPAYFIDSAGDVHFRGIMHGGTPSVVAFTLPLGAYHTDFNYMMTQGSSGGVSALARLDVGTNGVATVSGYAGGGNNDWVSLAGAVISNPAGAWLGTIILANGWTRFDNNWPPPQYCINKYGVLSLRGLVKGGTTTIPTKIATKPVPSAMSPAYHKGTLVSTAGVSGNNGGARLDVQPDGSLEFVGFVSVLNGNNGWMWVGSRWFVGDR
jgi:hypothetical protein